MDRYLTLLGFGVAVIGGAIEVVGIAAMIYWPLRRRLPPSPISVQSAGCYLFTAGVLIIALAQTLLK